MGFPNIPAFSHKHYQTGDCLLYKVGNDARTIRKDRMVSLLTSEQALREKTQQMEVLRQNIITLQKTITIESGASHDRDTNRQLQEEERKLKECERQRANLQYDLYQAECMLSGICKNAYDDLRCDATWYMREGLIQDCSDRGGCCSRKCGCCAERHLSGGPKGIGHCTLQCGCCRTFQKLQGIEFSIFKRQRLRWNFRDRLTSKESPHILRMADLFFCPLKRQDSKNRNPR